MPENRRKLRRLLLSEENYWRLVAASQKAGLIPAFNNGRRDVAKLGAEAMIEAAMPAIEYQSEQMAYEAGEAKKAEDKRESDMRIAERFTERFHGDLTGYEGDDENE